MSGGPSMGRPDTDRAGGQPPGLVTHVQADYPPEMYEQPAPHFTHGDSWFWCSLCEYDKTHREGGDT